MMKITHMLLSSTLLLGLTSTAYANHHMGEAGGQHCEHADMNKDGVISRDEFMKKHQARAEKMFDKLDTNKDGKIDANERKAGHEAMERRHTAPEKNSTPPK